MRFLICSNFSYPHIGGSEVVIHNIAKGLVSNGFSSFIMSFTAIDRDIIDGIEYIKCPADSASFLDKIQKDIKPDAILVYGDHFKHLLTLLKSVDIRIAIALVGGDILLCQNELENEITKKISDIKIVVHSKYYQDYRYCQEKNINAYVIPNGVSLSEFNLERYGEWDIIESYGFSKDAKTVLTVSNFCPEKGYEILGDIYKEVYRQFGQVQFLVFGSTVKIPNSEKIEKDFRQQVKDLPCLVIKNAPRSHLVKSYFASDIFAFPSFREVSPLVLLEAMASSLPFVGFDVGNIQELNGGIYIKRENNTIIPCILDKTRFIDAILNFLNNDELRKEKGQKGRLDIQNKHNWEQIVRQYIEVLSDD